MHPDCKNLVDLQKADQQKDNIADQIGALKADRNAGESTYLAGCKAENQRKQELVALEEREQAHNQRYEKYLQKAKSTQRLIDTGQAHNFEAAQVQLSQCLLIADQEETALLELMEEMEIAEQRIEDTSTQVALRKRQFDDKQKYLEEQLPNLESELQHAENLRKQQSEKVRSDYLKDYEQLKKKLRHAVVTIQETSCNSCGMEVSSMTLAEHKRGSGVHRCDNCNRFLGEVL